VQQVSDEDRPVAPGGQAQHGRAGGVARRGLQGEVFVDAIQAVPQHGLPGLVDGRDAVLVDQAVGLPHAVAVPVVRAVVEVVRGGDEVPGVGKGRYPLPVRVEGVPADVIDVEVGVDDDVHVPRVDTGPHQKAGQITFSLVEGPHARPLAPVARAGVDQHGPPPAAQHPGLQSGHHQAGVRLPVVRCRPVLIVPPHIGGDRREHDGGGLERLVRFDDPDDLDPPSTMPAPCAAHARSRLSCARLSCARP
jgi:hypothetical protein